MLIVNSVTYEIKEYKKLKTLNFRIQNHSSRAGLEKYAAFNPDRMAFLLGGKLKCFRPSRSTCLHGGQGWECLLLADDQLLVLMRDVSLDLALKDQVGQDALGLVGVDVLHLHLLQRHQEGLDRHLVGLQQEVDLLEEISAMGKSTDF